MMIYPCFVNIMLNCGCFRFRHVAMDMCLTNDGDYGICDCQCIDRAHMYVMLICHMYAIFKTLSLGVLHIYVMLIYHMYALKSTNTYYKNKLVVEPHYMLKLIK